MDLTKKLFGVVGIFALLILSFSLVSAQTTQCVELQNANVPTSIINNQGTVQVTFELNNTGTGCTAPRNITAVSLSSDFQGTSHGSWTFNTNLPVTIPVGQVSTFTATYNIPSSGTGSLNTAVTVTATTEAGNNDPNSPYTFSLPQISIQDPSPTSSFEIIVPANPVLLGSDAIITLENTGTVDLLNIILSETTNFGATFNPGTVTSLLSGTISSPVNVLLGNLDSGKLDFGLNNINFKATSSSGVEANATIQVLDSFCSDGPVGGNLTIKDVEINNDGDGEDDEWLFFDEIEIEIEVENTYEDDIDAMVEIGFFDEDGGNQANDLIFLNDGDFDDEEYKVDINDDDEEVVIARFLVPADIDEGNYKLAIKVYDEDEGEDMDCTDSSAKLNKEYYEEISVDPVDDDEKSIVVTDIEFDTPVGCGDTVTGSFEVHNIGKNEEERVKITMKNGALGVDQEFEITKDFDTGDREVFNFAFSVPNNVANDLYVLEFMTFFDYDDGYYDEESEDTFNGFLDVIGCSGSGSSNSVNALISATLESEALPGEELVVTATITNTGGSSANFIINARDFANWADLDGISDSSLSLDSGESETITLTFDVNEDVLGAQSFTLQVASEGKIKNQEVQVNFPEETSGITGGSIFNLEGSSGLIWVIGIINVVLIILIIVVAVRLSRK